MAALLLVALAAVLIALWFSRERIAGHIIEGQLRANGLPATYTIEKIAGGEEVLRDVRIGDPARPDLTIDRAAVSIVYRLGLPRLGTITLTRPRLYGTYTGGKLSFGSLDKVLFRKTGQPPALPALDVRIDDGRALLLTDYGKIAAKIDGAGRLDGGFRGTLGAIAPSLTLPGCALARATAYGEIAVRSGRASFDGPVRLVSLSCPDSNVRSGPANAQLDLTLDRDLGGVTGGFKLRGRHFVAGSADTQTVALDGDLALRSGNFTARLDGNLAGVTAPQVSAALLAVDGFVRARDGFSHFTFNGTIDGRSVSPGPGVDAALVRAAQASTGTLLAPMLQQVRTALAREKRGSRLMAEVDARSDGGALAMVLPQATLTGGSGEVLLSLSRFQLGTSGSGRSPPRISGNFSTGGQGLPRIAGRMEQGAVLRLTMAPYRAGPDSLALPSLTLAQAPDGSLGFTGTVALTGAIPGGRAEGLQLPLTGDWGSNGTLAVGTACAPVRFARLTFGSMELDGRSLTVCPPAGGAILRKGSGGLRIAAGVASLDLSGEFGATPMRLTSGPVGFAWPGTISAKSVDIALGPPDAPTRFRLADIEAHANKDFAGTFAGVEARLAAVPLDITGASGEWRYAGGALALSNAHFDLTDRQTPARFEKLSADGATLTLHDSRIDAAALLHDPGSGRSVARVTVRHDLSNSTGHADLAVDSLKFDKALQPTTLTPLALGLVANVDGTVSGNGVIDWNGEKVTSSGRFASSNLDFAAPFGPVKGLKGALVFTDLLNLVTAPDQTFTVASVNPGIEVNDGIVTLSLLPGKVLSLKDAHWPFMGGTLHLEPVVMHMGVSEPRRYVLDIAGLDAAKFLSRMEISNLSATGVFDGKLPLVFTENGGTIENGMLESRDPGGNVSYIGELTYKNLSTMANFAFDALKSLDYKHMTIAMNGSLSGEIVTNVRFDGVKQGAGAKRNFITKRLANLPLRFVVNIRAPFYALIVNFKSFYDPKYVQDPRTVGLLDAQGRPVANPTKGPVPAPQPTPSSGAPAATLPPKPDIQPPESENRP